MPAPAGIQGVWGLVYPLMVRQAHHERGTPLCLSEEHSDEESQGVPSLTPQLR